MTSGLAVVGAVLCVSMVEGLWVWLLACAISEVAGQVHPSLGFVGLVLFAAWLSARVVALLRLPIERRQWILAGAGVGLALVVGTIQSGLVVPVQLLIGHYEPDLRGSGITLLILVAYLWARGLALANGVTRERIIGHIAIAASALTAVLMFLPLTDAVRDLGFGTVVASFALALAALLLTQAMGVEAHELSPTKWGLIAGGLIILVVIAGGAATGALSSGVLVASAQTLGRWGRFMTPVTDVILLALGHLAEALAYSFQWLAQMFGVNPEDILQNMQAAQDSRPQFDDQTRQNAPELMGLIVAFVCTAFFVIVIVWLFRRLVHGGRQGEDEDIRELRTSVGRNGGAGLFGGARDWLASLHRGGESPSDTRELIRQHYRALQVLMARAGMPRALAETPTEYERTLAFALPTAEADLRAITAAYVLARYAEATTSLPAAGEVERAIQGVRSALRERPPA